ncbi:DUF6311 domain-containing protein [Seonamhaeicola sp. ML3]|uniref:DUF6311 domain-containing protein n=1 Tax=Seonamhaeicola sp. ML3 TaxID=2937786 RepID=UPI00200FB59E|nr:DUF6311 domain-containing protein [Seonamhaeicola sp. ML3]
MFKNLIKNKYLLISLLTLVGFHFVYGLQIIIPNNINWLMSAYHDWGQHYLGWAFFRNEEWHFPIGYIENFNYPAGTNVGFTDSIPVLAIIFKTFSSVIPENFQYFGLWLLSNHLLTAFFSIKILSRFKVSTIQILLFAILITYNPVLVYRCMHPALCAHWLILASTYYYLSFSEIGVFKALNRQLVLTVFSALVNPYLFFIVVGFGFILPIKAYYIHNKISLKLFLFYLFVPIVLVLLSWYTIGMISFNSNVDMEVSNSYGLYSFNLNSFWNPDGFSKFLPGLKKVTNHQYEGFGYLGLGFIVLIVSTVIIYFTKLNTVVLKKKELLPLYLLCFGYFLFSITNSVSYGEQVLFEYYLPSYVSRLGSVFRASGRFVWVLYYLMLFYSIVVLTKSKINLKIKTIIVVCVFIVQIVDTNRLLFSRTLPFGEYKITKFSEEIWIKLTSGFDKIITYKPFNNHLGYKMSYQDLCLIALKNNLPITCGYVARETRNENKKYLESIDLDISKGRFNEEAIYIVSPEEISNFYYVLERNEMEVRFLDNFYFIHSLKKKNDFQIAKSRAELSQLDKLKKDIKHTNFKKKLDTPPIITERDNIKNGLGRRIDNDEVIQLRGWAFLENSPDNVSDSIYLFLQGKNNTYLYKTKIRERPDVVEVFNDKGLINCGYSVTIFKEDLKIDNYRLGIGVKTKDNKWAFNFLNTGGFSNLSTSTPPKKVKNIPELIGSIIKNVERVDVNSKDILIQGWAAVKNRNASGSEIKILLTGNNMNYLIDTEKISREDVSIYFKNQGGFNYDNSGFRCSVKKVYLEKGIYSLGVLINHNDKEYFNLTDKKIEIK